MAEENAEITIQIETYDWERVKDFCAKLTRLIAKSGLSISDIRKSCDFCIECQVPGGFKSVRLGSNNEPLW